MALCKKKTPSAQQSTTLSQVHCYINSIIRHTSMLIVTLTSGYTAQSQEELLNELRELREQLANSKEQIATIEYGIARAATFCPASPQLIEKPLRRKGESPPPSLPDILEKTANIMYDEYQLMLRVLHSVSGLLEVTRLKKDQEKETEDAVKELIGYVH
ncbi:hypothetical protein BDY19DRAFT_910892 [Irpex rosettiformis]|uniref:Uncharacterized protein n=1 Tax=Irpex rosettiformis TaxID=378272 RepID=A0ACB8TM27_9APHY|nr:hypothetical protein BDY19DRAFT_910892 [Irpex rosettiformis]